MLEIRALQAFYGPAQALFGVDLRLQAGQLLVLQGLNGAGKSTLLKSVMGLEVRTRGQLLLAGTGVAQDISAWPAHRRASAGLGYVAEDRRLFGELTVQENLQVAGGRGSGERLDWVLERFGLLKPMLKRPAALMSGGEQQMLALARTLMTGPRLLLLDEPCEGISPVLVEAMVQVLLDLRGEGLGLLVAEQNRQLAQAADQVLELVAGTVRGRRQSASPQEQGRTMSITTTASGLQYEDTVLGTGATAKAGQYVRVHYTGWLYEDGQAGAKFDSSKDRGEPFEFSLGAGHVIRGWDEGVQGMAVGGTRRLIIPAELGYGARGAGGVIPPNATLLFEVDFLGTA